MEECQTVWEMKKDDLLMKERLTKLAILDTLLAKNQPLTEAEEVVKNKLLALKWDDIATASHLFQRIIVGIHQTVDTALKELIRRDQEELIRRDQEQPQYPPQPG
ncbi:hypothetical protein Bca52824_048772 [Brassica carinata]|uniref:Uncharacterized protein n=1 Tax=Brassica carinata TaxID=52824 RepID=A0A8X7RJM0_BRACI|nr:hypothetical protein Bca52824_048772 [Brassica carinata]